MAKRVVNLVMNNFTNDSRVLKIGKSLSKNGFEVVVVALLKGNVPEQETMEGFGVHRIKLRTMNLPKGKVFGLLKYVEFFTKVILRYRKYDVWHCNDFEPFLIGVIAKFFRRKLKLVYDSHEYQSETFGKKPFEKQFIKFCEKKWIKKTSFFITVGNGIVAEYKRLYNIQKAQLIYNAPYRSEVKESNLLRETLSIDGDKKIFLYQGGLTQSRGIPILLEAFAKMNDPSIVSVFMGNGVFAPLVEEYAAKFAHIYYLKSVPYHQLIAYTASADVGLISTENICLNNYYCMPNKLFEYAQARIPMIVNNLFDCKNFVLTHKIGKVVPENTPENWKSIIEAMCNTPKSNYLEGLKKVKEIYHWENEEKKLLEIYQSF